MKRDEWKVHIKNACEEVGTYRESFEAVIDTLSTILETRDETFAAYDGVPIIEHTNSHGETNTAKNPALMLWNDLNAQALSFWRDLGLTPAGLKKIKEGALKSDEKESALEKALREIGGQELERGNKVRGINKGRHKASVCRVKAGG